MKKKIIISILLIVNVFFFIISYKVFGAEEKYIQISGTIIDENGNGIKDIEIYTSDNMSEYIAKTNENGKYEGYITADKESNLVYKYNQQYQMIGITGKKIQYKTDFSCEKARVIFYYNNNEQLLNYKYINGKLKKIIEDNYKEYEVINSNYTEEKQMIEQMLTNANKIGSGMKIERKILNIGNVEDGKLANLQTEINQNDLSHINMIFYQKNQPNINIGENISFRNNENEILEMAYKYLEISKIESDITLQNDETKTDLSKLMTQNINFDNDYIINIQLKKKEKQQGSQVSLNQGDGNINGTAKDNNNNPISNVLVELYNESNKIASARTDENGKYSFLKVKGATKIGVEYKSKKYTIKFTYGDIGQLKNSKKYNGQDYKTSNYSFAIDDNSRRTTVNEKWKEITYKNGKEIAKLDQSGIIGLEPISTNTYMIAKGEVEFNLPDENLQNKDLILEERMENEVIINNYISNIKVTLSNGQVLVNSKFDENGNEQGQSEKKYLLSIPDPYGGIKELTNMDLEILYGGKIEFEYTTAITSKNYDNKFVIYNYIDDRQEYDKRNDSLWKIVDLSDINVNISDNMKNQKKKVAESKKIEVKKGETKKVSIVTSHNIAADDFEDEYNNYSEIALYENKEGRRIYITIPANLNVCDSNFELEKNDSDKAEVFIIVPPTGEIDLKIKIIISCVLLAIVRTVFGGINKKRREKQ